MVKSTLAVTLVVSVLPHVLVAVSVGESAFAVTNVLPPLPYVLGTVGVGLRTNAIVLIS